MWQLSGQPLSRHQLSRKKNDSKTFEKRFTSPVRLQLTPPAFATTIKIADSTRDIRDVSTKPTKLLHDQRFNLNRKKISKAN